MDYTLNCNGRLLSLHRPLVMGILNVTPDSFFADSRKQTEHDIAQRVTELVSQGAAIIDVGACSTRPDSDPVTADEEALRLRKALAVVRREAPDAIVSVDTFRADIARMVVEEYGADIINDVGTPATAGGGAAIERTDMFRMVARLRVPYIYMSTQGTLRDISIDFAEAAGRLRSLGQKDIILDPGFGFGKTLEQNYSLLQHFEQLQAHRLPLLVGVSRKSMVWRLLQSQPSQALNGTTVLHTISLLKGASILRVHDVREALECIRIVEAMSTADAAEEPTTPHAPTSIQHPQTIIH